LTILEESEKRRKEILKYPDIIQAEKYCKREESSSDEEVKWENNPKKNVV
jgi:hypothetical protein